MHKCMTMKHLMHERSYKDRKNQIKDQTSKNSTIGTLPHPNGTIVWNECLKRSKTRVGGMRTRDAHSQGVRALNIFFNNMLFSLKTSLLFLAQFPKSTSFFFSFDFFKSMKLRALRSQMTKGTTMVTHNVFRSTRPFEKGFSNMVLFPLQLMTLRSYMTNHTTIVASWNKLRSIQNLRLRPKQRL